MKNFFRRKKQQQVQQAPKPIPAGSRFITNDEYMEMSTELDKQLYGYLKGVGRVMEETGVNDKEIENFKIITRETIKRGIIPKLDLSYIKDKKEEEKR